MGDRSAPNLPRGISQGVWHYIQTEEIAGDYDEFFATNRLFEFDEQVVARYFQEPGWVVDLGCGTGRALIPLARRGFRTVGVDLSRHMLQIVGEKAALERLSIGRVRANLVELDFIRDAAADYCTCLFSTLGMIHDRANRRRTLEHAHRLLKPSGLFVLHVHNLWYNLYSARNARWLAGHLVRLPFLRGAELGDKVFTYRGVPRMYLHTFTRRELSRELKHAGFRIRELIPLDARRLGRLSCPWFFGRLRANGWIVVCEK